MMLVECPSVLSMSKPSRGQRSRVNSEGVKEPIIVIIYNLN